MKLFHASTVSVEKPLLLKNEIGRDFGAAFYTTDFREQAQRWVIRKALIANRQNKREFDAIVSEYTFDEVNGNCNLKVLRFGEPDAEWLDLVIKCRTINNYKHGYDIVIGKITDDRVGETISYVIQGIMRKEDAIEKLKFQKINSQIAFCSKKALAFLEYQSCYSVSIK